MIEPRPLKGVNLGGWLVLEKWMTPSLFKGTAAVDEYGLCSELGSTAAAVLSTHRQTFITERDFVWLAEQGIEAIRLPVGYWLFEDQPPFISCQAYVDQAFEWAAKTGMKILLDVHAVPGSQNGQDHSGRAGSIGWYRQQSCIDQTLAFVRQLAATYGSATALLGIELLNEPAWRNSKRKLKRYYQQAYEIVREQCGQSAWVVFNPYSMAWRWRRELRAPSYLNVLADVHSYQCFSKSDKQRPLARHIAKLLGPVCRRLMRIGNAHPIIIGEWSLALDSASLPGLTDEQRSLALKTYATTQLLTYSQSAAWFYWSYKTEGGGSWSLRDSIERGWLPDLHKL